MWSTGSVLHFKFYSGKKDAVTQTKAPQYQESHAIMKLYPLSLETWMHFLPVAILFSKTRIKILPGFYDFRSQIMKVSTVHSQTSKFPYNSVLQRIWESIHF